MADNKIVLKKIVDLFGDKFFIPSYQRGYRWKKQQVNDLLDDIWEFYKKGRPGFYCLQPLTVTPKETKKEDFDKILDECCRQEQNYRDALFSAINSLTEWEVIDGQQRLTTIYLILSFLQEKQPFFVSYETRLQSREFLKDIKQKLDSEEVNRNIDFFHMVKAYDTVTNWFSDKNEEDKRIFLETLLEYVQVIWYEVYDEVPTKVFTRLNIGKIALTNAELIKALLLNSSNWQNITDKAAVELRQMEIASRWDSIEYTLQNKEFWMFIHAEGYDTPTRIELIFEYICKNDILECEKLYKKHFPQKNEDKDAYNDKLGDDKYKTFRYFNLYFEMKKKESLEHVLDKVRDEFIEKVWDKVEKVFNTLQEWYDDCVLFHYVGFLIEANGERELYNLLNEWNKTNSKKEYEIWLKHRIKECSCIKNYSCLSTQYEINGNPDKKRCKSLLLLFNIQSVINQNKSYVNNELYQSGVFYKFPFHLYKLEKWDIEHIDSNTTNELPALEDKKEWVLNALYALQAEESKIELEDRIKNGIIVLLQGNSPQDFNEIQDTLSTKINHGQAFSPEDKNQIWNFALLDCSTNRGYHNDMFPTKRRKLLGKDQGVKIILMPDQEELAKGEIVINTNHQENANAIAFVPPCTKNVFLKYYTPGKNDLWSWTKADAEYYRQAILNTLCEFGVTLKEGTPQ